MSNPIDLSYWQDSSKTSNGKRNITGEKDANAQKSTASRFDERFSNSVHSVQPLPIINNTDKGLPSLFPRITTSDCGQYGKANTRVNVMSTKQFGSYKKCKFPLEKGSSTAECLTSEKTVSKPVAESLCRTEGNIDECGQLSRVKDKVEPVLHERSHSDIRHSEEEVNKLFICSKSKPMNSLVISEATTAETGALKLQSLFQSIASEGDSAICSLEVEQNTSEELLEVDSPLPSHIDINCESKVKLPENQMQTIWICSTSGGSGEFTPVETIDASGDVSEMTEDIRASSVDTVFIRSEENAASIIDLKDMKNSCESKSKTIESGAATGGYAVREGKNFHSNPITCSLQFQRKSFRVYCPGCKYNVNTNTELSVGSLNWTVAGFLCAMGCYAGCCLVPFFLDSLKDVKHTCPNCSTQIASYCHN